MYDKTVWIDHIADPNTGEVLQQGTRFDQQKMNNIENGIYDAHMSLQELEDSKVKEFAITLAADQWIDKTYTIQNSLLTTSTSGRLIMGVNSDQSFAELKAARISKSAVLSNGSLAISASGIVPTGNINLILQIKSTSTSEFIIDLPSDGGDADTLGHKEPAYYASKADYLALLQRIEKAEKELEEKISNKSMQFLLPSLNWDSYNRQTLPCDKFTCSSTIMPMYMMPASNIESCSRAGISIVEQTDTTITFQCSNRPREDIIVGVIYLGEDSLWYEIIEELGEKEIIWYTEEMLPDPNVLLLINSENNSPLSDKSIYAQTIINVNAKQYGVSGGYNKGSYSLFYNSFDFNKDSNDVMLVLDSIKNFDPSQEWQLSFSAILHGGNYGSNKDTNIAYFNDLGCGFKMQGDRTTYIYFYYRNSNGTIKKVSTEIDFYSYGSEWIDCHFLLQYRHDSDDLWKYFIKIRYKGHNTSITDEIEKSFVYSDITLNQSSDNTKLSLGGISNKYSPGVSTYYSYMNLDEIILKNKVDKTYIFPTYNDSKGGFEINIPTQVEHSKIIDITNKTVFRHNVDGTVDKYTPNYTYYPYDLNSKVLCLLHCDDKPSKDANGCSIYFNSNITVDTENKRVGTGSHSYDTTEGILDFILKSDYYVTTGNLTIDTHLLLKDETSKVEFDFRRDDRSDNEQLYSERAFKLSTTKKSATNLCFSVTVPNDRGSQSRSEFINASGEEINLMKYIGKWVHFQVVYAYKTDSKYTRYTLYIDGNEIGYSEGYIPHRDYIRYMKIKGTNISVDEVRLCNDVMRDYGNKTVEMEWIRLENERSEQV